MQHKNSIDASKMLNPFDNNKTPLQSAFFRNSIDSSTIFNKAANERKSVLILGDQDINNKPSMNEIINVEAKFQSDLIYN